jgi:hypothetical protein
MNHEGEKISAIEKENPLEQEVSNLFPEIFTNEPLENTSLVYSVPVMGEWNNGNLQRMFTAMFSQHIGEQAFEVELIANIGNGLMWLTSEKNKTEDGKCIINKNPNSELGKKSLELLKESKESLKFVKQIIEIQRLARIVKSDENDVEALTKLNELVNDISDPLLKDIAELAVKKAENISLVAIDATHTNFSQTKYSNYHMQLGALRTMGADIATARFKDPDMVLGMFDADTLPEGNNSVKNMQDIFAENPGLHYFFTGMSNLPPGHSEKLISIAPKENLRRTLGYNDSHIHGSPQIYFKLSSYEKLKEIAGWQSSGFHGDEDRDTSLRLIHCFGKLQDGLLFESSAHASTMMTADRLDGSVDSSVRKAVYEGRITDLKFDMENLNAFERKVLALAEKESEAKKEKILKDLEKSKNHFKKEQKIQQKFNRLLAKALIKAKDAEIISINGDNLIVDEKAVLKLRGGKALLHYVRANKSLIKEILSSKEDLDAIERCLESKKESPDQELSNFQIAIKEYLGESESEMSDMHLLTAKTLALAEIYRKYFETKHFLPTKEDYANPDSWAKYDWPENPDDKDIEYNFGDPKTRQEIIRQSADVQGSKIPKKEAGVKRFIDFDFHSVPMFSLFKSLINKLKK